MIEVMRDRTIALIDDFRRTILTSDWNYKLYNQPLWKHIYHALYWFDYWYCTPENFSKADFHTESLHSLDVDSDVQISKEEMLSYLDKVKKKLTSTNAKLYGQLKKKSSRKNLQE